MKNLLTGFIAILLFPVIVSAQQPLPEETVFKIKREAFQKSQIEDLVFYLTDYAGPRLAGSRLSERAEKLAKEKLIELGFSNARIEHADSFPSGGWDNVKTYAAMTAPYYSNFTALPKAWTGSTKGLVSGEVVLLNIATPEDIENFRGKLNGKIVLMPELYRYEMRFEPLATRHNEENMKKYAVDSRPQVQINQPETAVERTAEDIKRKFIDDLKQKIKDLLAEEKPAVLISGDGAFNVPVPKEVPYKYGDPEPIAELILPLEAHGRMVRLIAKNISVSMEVEIKNEYYNNQVINNVIAEIPGSDPKLKDEVVLIGGHLDSCHGGTGATDDAAGCVVMMEALRIIKETGVKPRRTIRIALWGGEEQDPAYIGSKGYRQKYLYDANENKPRKGYEQFALYLNMDYGAGKFRGVFMQGNDMAYPWFKQWMKPLESMGFSLMAPRSVGGTDHQAFDRIGLPAFAFVQDMLEYGRSMHTMMDTSERLIIADLQYNAAIVACLALSAAMDNGKIPPKPLPEGFTMRTN